MDHNMTKPVKILGEKPAFINIGLDIFAETLKAQGATVCNVRWQPPPELAPDIKNILKEII